MPSPPIPRSISSPNLPKPDRLSPSPSRHLPSSSRSTRSAPSLKSWEKAVKKLSFKTNNGSPSTNSDLTEESLKEHNKRHEILDEYKHSNRCSPYYKGLTDASLAINRGKHVGCPSPGRESRATTVATNSSSLSTFIVLIQEWSVCFSFKSKRSHDHINHPDTAAPLKPVHTSSSSYAPPPMRPREAVVKEVVLERKEYSGCLPEISDHNGTNALVLAAAAAANKEKKPLRERVSEPQPARALPAKRVVFADEKGSEKKFKWADKYRPDALKDFICNRDKAMHLQSLMKAEECGHFIFEGPPGVGKKTMIWAFLREAFGPEKIRTREEQKTFNLKGESIRSIEVSLKESSQHVEVNLSDLKGYEKHIIVELIKDQHNKKKPDRNFQCDPVSCRAIILYEADKLSTDALLYMGWLLEKYKGSSKVFFCCSDISKLEPIKMLCTIVKLLPPSNEEIVEVLEFIAEQEGIELPHRLAEKIAANSKNNLRQAIRSLEASWQINKFFKEDQIIYTGWEDDIANIAKNIIEEQSPKQLYIIRGKLQKLIEHNVSPDFIFKALVGELKKLVDEEFHPRIGSLYDEYNSNDQSEEMGKRFHDPLNVHLFMRLEEFIAKFMSWYKYSVVNAKP